ncbi:DUF4253 domain-containing protein [Phytomonospora sp. NPDC050363]|uniref:DUF4253 domain-containing protein n=1 Tax=Phytomonospora sp. NPDC050363 TaxID=3155642 RepID=UPI0034052509
MDLAEVVALHRGLPPGRLVTPEDGGPPVLWLSDGAAEVDQWRSLLAEHPRTGLYPLVLEELPHGGEEFRPWESGELYPLMMSAARHSDAATVLESWWGRYAGTVDDGSFVTAPYGPHWPGLAEGASFTPEAAAKAADDLAAEMFAKGNRRLGLVAAPSGADALVTAGWSGPMNYDNDFGLFAAVLADWGRRFGATVVGAGFAQLWVSVAAPPESVEEALPLAAEVFAFCPDTVWQGADILEMLAERLLGERVWRFWWD